MHTHCQTHCKGYKWKTQFLTNLTDSGLSVNYSDMYIRETDLRGPNGVENRQLLPPHAHLMPSSQVGIGYRALKSMKLNKTMY